MAVYVIARHMVGGGEHEHIAEVKWENRSNGKTGHSSRAEMVKWINDGGDARVADGSSYVKVTVVKADPPYIRTIKDGKLSDNLLALPTY